jgi:hypothetical protein
MEGGAIGRRIDITLAGFWGLLMRMNSGLRWNFFDFFSLLGPLLSNKVRRRSAGLGWAGLDLLGANAVMGWFGTEWWAVISTDAMHRRPENSSRKD